MKQEKLYLTLKQLTLNSLENALKDAVKFELYGFINKREYYSRMYKEDEKRIDMLQARWNILEGH